MLIIPFVIFAAATALPAFSDASNAYPLFDVDPDAISVDSTLIKELSASEYSEYPKEIFKNDTITFHLSKTKTTKPLELPVTCTAAWDGYWWWETSEAVDISALGPLKLGDLIYVYVSFEEDSETIVLEEPDTIEVTVQYTIDLDDIYIDDLEYNEPITIEQVPTDKAFLPMTVTITTSPTLAGATNKITHTDLLPEGSSRWLYVPSTDQEIVDTLDLVCYSTIYIFVQFQNGSLVFPEPATIFITETRKFSLSASVMFVGTKKMNQLTITRRSENQEWANTIKVKLTTNRPTPTNADVTFTATKDTGDKWLATDVNIEALGTLTNNGKIYVFVSSQNNEEFFKSFATINVYDDPKFTYTLDQETVLFSDLASDLKLPISFVMPTTRTGEPYLTVAFTNKDGVKKELHPMIEVEEETEEFFILVTGATALGITNSDLPAEITIDFSLSSGLSWDAPTTTLTVTPDFAIDPKRILPSQIADTPAITITADKDSWGATLEAKFTFGDKTVPATVSTTGSKPSRTITIDKGADLTELGLTEFPAVVDVHLSIDGGDTFLPSTARLTVGEGEDRALGIAPLTGMLAALALIFIALF